MKTNYFTLFLLIINFVGYSQVGINTTTPNAQLDIRSSSQVAPAATDGILIPKVDTFPAVNPTIDQQGILVYLTTTSGSNPPGFYYWNNPSTSWIPIKGTDTGTLDQAYDFGGPGAGNTIIADAGAVTIAGTDGLVSTGILNSGALAPSGAGEKMFWNPRKAAFRAGSVNGTQWDNASVGRTSVAIGLNTTASGINSVAMGNGTIASGTSSTALGNGAAALGQFSTAIGGGTTSSGFYSTAFGNNTTASGEISTAFGSNTTALGSNSTAFGLSTTATTFCSTAFGLNTTASGPASTSFGSNTTSSSTGSTAFGSNAIASGDISTAFGLSTTATAFCSTAFGRQNTASSFGETVIGVGATNYTPSTNGATQFRVANAADRLFVIGNAIDDNNNNTVDDSERSDAMIVLKNGLTRLPSMDNAMIDAADGKTVVTKEYLQDRSSGTLDQAYDFGSPGAGNTIIADAGAVTIDGTDGLVSTGNIGSGALAPSGAGVRMVWNPRKAAFRVGSVSSTQWDDDNVGTGSAAFGQGTTASGSHSTAFGISTTASGVLSTSLGFFSIASGSQSTAFGNQTRATGENSTAFGVLTRATGENSIAFGRQTQAFSENSTAFGQITTATGENSNAFGRQNTARSYAETVIGIGATNYTPSANGTTQFRTANATDRLFVIGNAIDANNNGGVDLAERSDAMVVLKNGNTGIGTSTPARRLHVSNGTSGATSNANSAVVIESDGAIYQHFLSPSTTENGILFVTETGSIRGGIIYNSIAAQEGFLFRTGGNTNRMTLTNAGDLGIGTTAPAEKLHVSGPAGLTAIRIANTSGIGSTSNVALDFFRRTNLNTDWRIHNVGAFLTIANSADDLATINDLYQFQGPRFIPINDASQNLGQGTSRWNTLFASNGTINTSDAREKKNIQNLQYGLNTLMQLRPVSFEWKKQDGSGTKLGLIAQELQRVIPEVVRDWDWEEDELGNLRKVASPILGVYYSDLIPVLIKATQEQQELIQQQEQQLFQQQTLLGQLLEQQQQLLQRLEKLEK